MTITNHQMFMSAADQYQYASLWGISNSILSTPNSHQLFHFPYVSAEPQEGTNFTSTVDSIQSKLAKHTGGNKIYKPS